MPKWVWHPFFQAIVQGDHSAPLPLRVALHITLKKKFYAKGITALIISVKDFLIIWMGRLNHY